MRNFLRSFSTCKCRVIAFQIEMRQRFGRIFLQTIKNPFLLACVGANCRRKLFRQFFKNILAVLKVQSEHSEPRSDIRAVLFRKEKFFFVTKE